MLSVVLVGRTFWVSIEKAGTPLFPFGTCLIKTASCVSEDVSALQNSSQALIAVKDNYGLHSRGPTAFVQHLWRVGVPTLSAYNNEYDYPLGFTWYFCILLILMAAFSLKTYRHPDQERPCQLFLLGLAFWASWWMGSQQSRWLYPALTFLLLGGVPLMKRFQPIVLIGVLTLQGFISLNTQWKFVSTQNLTKTRNTILTEQRAANSVDPKTGITSRKETLYVDQAVTDLQDLDPIWTFPIKSNK